MDWVFAFAGKTGGGGRPGWLGYPPAADLRHREGEENGGGAGDHGRDAHATGNAGGCWFVVACRILDEGILMIDLRSDTVTRPSPGMREAMACAEVGDDVMGADPTVNALEDRLAGLLGKAAAVFVPSGTMSNLLAYLSQTRPGESIILSAKAHPYRYEGGNLALVGGLLPRLIEGALGKLSAEEVGAAIVRSDDVHLSNTSLVSIENTTNDGGGACWSEEEVAAVSAVTHGAGLRLHCDGARFFNAVVATGTSSAAYAAPCDTVSICLSKGLGAPVGSVLVGDAETITRARRYRKMLGGGMRQAGILAAAGLYALEHHVEGLAEDHRRAREFRAALEGMGVRFSLPSPTNILFIDVPGAPALGKALEALGVFGMGRGERMMRFVFHRDILDADLEEAIGAFKTVLGRAG